MTDKTKADDTAADLAKATADAKNRIKAIMAAPEAEGRKDLAEHFAYDTEMTAEAAVAALAKAPKAAAAAPQKTDAELHEERRLNAAGLNGVAGNRPAARSPAAAAASTVANMRKLLGLKEAN